MGFKKARHCWLLFSLFLFSPLYGREKPVFPLFIDHIGKGYASIASVRDSRAIFFNPATISSIPDNFYALDISFANSKTVNEIFQNPEDLQNRISSSYGQEEAYGYVSGNGPLYLGVKFDNIQLVLFHSFQMDFRTYFSWLPSAGVYGDVSAVDDLGVAAGFSFPLPVPITGSKWETLYWGFSLKVFQRVKGINPQIPLETIADMGSPLEFIQNNLNPGRAIGFTNDLGLYYRYQDFSAGAVLYNLLSLPMVYYPVKLPTIWTSSSDTEIEGYKDSLGLDLGFGASYVFSEIGGIPTHFLKNLTLSLELNEFFNNVDYPYFYQKIRSGAEITLANVIALRLGFLHGNLTFGLGYRFLILKIDTAYWQEKIGENTATNWGMEISIEF